MELIYAYGIYLITWLQEMLEDKYDCIVRLHKLFNPRHLLEFLFPAVSIVDSVFAAQVAMCVAFGGWSNTIIKWIIVEDRPYWWVRETSYYNNSVRPELQQFPETCDTSPGCPSGHVSAAATALVLVNMWIPHLVNDLEWPFLKVLKEAYPAKSLYFIAVISAAIARVFVGAHFPHQCLMGGLIGSFVTPSMCLLILDPFLLRQHQTPQQISRAWWKHVWMALGTIAVTVFVYVMYLALKLDPQWSTRMAFRWCKNKDYINVVSTPVYSAVQNTATLLGLALCVTPALAKYRHNTGNRVAFISLICTPLATQLFEHIQEMIPRTKYLFYSLNFLLYAVKPVVFLRLIPKLAMWPYAGRAVERPQPRAQGRPRTAGPRKND